MPVPFPGAAQNVGTLNTPPIGLGASATWLGGIKQSRGANVAVYAKVTHAATLHIKQYADNAGTILVQDSNVALVANTANSLLVSDGKLFASFEVSIVNSSGGTLDTTYLQVLQ